MGALAVARAHTRPSSHRADLWHLDEDGRLAAQPLIFLI